MKRIGRLFDAICDHRTLELAVWRAARGKREREEVSSFLSKSDGHLTTIIRELRSGTYCFGDYRTFSIRDPKSRRIHAPPFRDRVVHHAILAVAGPVFERGAIAHSYACRAGRGQHAALNQAKRWMQPDDAFLKIDVAKYYDSVPHDLLRVALARRFRERRLLALLDRLIDSHHHTPRHGLPIGALTSQYLGNFYLDVFDHWMNATARESRYLRYMDDMVVFGRSGSLPGLRDRAAEMLDGLGLRLKNDGVINRCSLGLPFLGFTLHSDRVRLNGQGRKRLRRRLKDVERRCLRGGGSELEMAARATALFAHARFADDLAWRRTVVGFSRIGEAPWPAPGDSRRHVEQHRQEVPVRLSQQEASR